MSRTIITKSGKSFFTNISEENLLGEICKELSLPHEDYGTGLCARLAFKMTLEEVLNVSKSLKEFSINCTQADFERYSRFFLNFDIHSFKRYLIEKSEIFESSEGYECVS